MRYGTVVEFFPRKGFGFIRPDFGQDIFFHVTALGACQPPPQILPGQPVKYELVPGTEPKPRRKRRAFDDDAPPPAAEPVRPQAQLVELIDKIPGGVLEDLPLAAPKRHPNARRRRPSFRRGKDGPAADDQDES